MSIRAWNGTAWVTYGISPTPSLNDSLRAVTATSTLQSLAYGPYLEHILLPALTLAPVPTKAAVTYTGPSDIALALAIGLPPALMLMLTIVGLECNRRRHPVSPPDSLTSGSYSPDKGL